jgi:hypothetical protein
MLRMGGSVRGLLVVVDSTVRLLRMPELLASGQSVEDGGALELAAGFDRRSVANSGSRLSRLSAAIASNSITCRLAVTIVGSLVPIHRVSMDLAVVVDGFVKVVNSRRKSLGPVRLANATFWIDGNSFILFGGLGIGKSIPLFIFILARARARYLFKSGQVIVVNIVVHFGRTARRKVVEKELLSGKRRGWKKEVRKRGR